MVDDDHERDEFDDDDDDDDDESEDAEEAKDGPRPGMVRPLVLAPLFVVTALLHAVAIASRFPDAAQLLPPELAPTILLLTFPLLMLEGYAEGRIDYGGSSVDLPLWMKIDSRPVRWSFTLAFTYLGVVALQTWELSIGPLDPTPPEGAPLAMRAQYFGMMTLVMWFPNYLAASSVFIPALRIVTAPFRRLPTLVSLLLLPLVGFAIGEGVLYLLDDLGGASLYAGAQQAIKDDPALTIGALIGGMLLPSLLALARPSASSKR